MTTGYRGTARPSTPRELRRYPLALRLTARGLREPSSEGHRQRAGLRLWCARAHWCRLAALPIHIDDSIIAYVNTKASALAPLFRSDAQGEILARLFLNPNRAFTISELARTANTPYASAHREVSRIVKMGLVTTEKRGQAVEVKARRDTPFFRPLAELLGLTYGPAVVIPNHLAGIAGIDQAYIYGSWAARREGEPGDPPGDIDLLIVGNPPRGEVYEASRIAGAALAREVNPRIVSAAAWGAADADPFLRTLAERPLIHLDLQETLS